jgi:acetyl-CoA carboxylase biotin carboxyl carrier protein
LTRPTSNGSAPVELDATLVRSLLEAFDQSDWLEMTVTVGNDRLHVSRRSRHEGAPAADPAPAPAVPATEELAPAEPIHAEPRHTTPEVLTGTVIESPSVGLFWRSPSPGAPPFVDVGTQVSAGDTLAIVEVMKLMNHVVAPGPGTVRAILAENGGRVEHGQPLFAIDPEG